VRMFHVEHFLSDTLFLHSQSCSILSKSSEILSVWVRSLLFWAYRPRSEDMEV